MCLSHFCPHCDLTEFSTLNSCLWNCLTLFLSTPTKPSIDIAEVFASSKTFALVTGRTWWFSDMLLDIGFRFVCSSILLLSVSLFPCSEIK